MNVRQLIVAFLAANLFSILAIGETELDKTVRNYAPGTGAISTDAYTCAIENLRWRQTQDEALRQVLRAQLDDVEKRFEMHDHEAEEMAEVIKRVGFVPIGVDGKLTSRCLEELLTVELEIATSTEMIKATTLAADQHRDYEKDRERKSVSSSFAALSARRDLLVQKLRRAEEMLEKGYASKEEILTAKAELAALEAEQAALKERLSNVPNRSRYAEQVIDLRIKIASLNARKAAVDKFLGRITAASKFSRELKRLDRKEEEIAARKTGITAKINEIELRIAETESFINLLERQLEELQKKKKASPESDK